EGARLTRGHAEELIPGVVNYPGALLEVPRFGGIRYNEVYPGIDVAYHGGAGGGFEYDFILSPGADPHRIRLSYQGGNGIRIGTSGDLFIATEGGEIRQAQPTAWQEVAGKRKYVAVRYVLRGRTVTLSVAKYNKSRSLIIDPALTWATYVGF